MATLTQSAKTTSKSNKESSNSRQTRTENQSATILDKRPATLAQNNIIVSMGSGSGAQRTAQLQAIMGGTAPIQRVKEDDTQVKDTSVENNTGLPDQLKSGIENISGISLNDVRVHPNSSQPGELRAHAFAQGTNIHLAPGQEKHLPHEAWHVVQQKQGRVQPTKQMGDGVNVNDHPGLEREATQMGQRALNHTPQTDTPSIQSVTAPSATAQLVTEDEISRRTARPMNKQMRQTARNQFSVNDQIKGFDKSNLKKRPSPPKANRRNAMKPQTPKQNTGKAVTRSTMENFDMASTPGVTANLANALGGIAEKDKHGDATMGQMAANTTKNVVSDATSKGKGFFGRMKEKASKTWGSIKNWWGGKKEAKPDDRSMGEKSSDMLGKAKNVAKGVAVRAAEGGAKATVGKVGDVGVNAYNAVKSGSDSFEAHNLASGRSNDLKDQAGGERDIGTAIASQTRNTHAKQGIESGVNAIRGGVGIVKSIGTLGTADLVEGGLKIAKDGAKKGAMEGLMGHEKKALGDRKNLTLGEAFDGQSKSGAANLKDYRGIVNSGKGELSEDDKIAAAKSRSALFQEGFDRSAGYESKKKANKKQNKANSMDTSALKDKMSLKDEAFNLNDLADKRREGINEGSQMLKPGNVKKRAQDMRKLKALGDDLKASDSGFTDNLVKNEDATHNRTKLVTERITEKADEAMGKEKKFRN